MGRIIMNDALRAAFSGVSGEVEVCEPDGRVVGWYVPQAGPPAMDPDELRRLYEWAKTEVSDEELDRVSRQPGGSTLAEIKKRLGWE